MNPIEAYIRQAAQARGIDPEIAVRVAKSEGGVDDPVRQSDYVKNGKRERSYGPFQLYIDGGLGNRALEAGIDPRDPNQWQRGVDFALNEAAQKGWGQWYGAKRVGIGNRAGIGGASPAGVAPTLSPQAAEFVQNNPQPGGFGPAVPDPNNPPSLFGSMSPGGGGQQPMSGPAAADAQWAMSPTTKTPGLGERLQGAGAAFSRAAKAYPAPQISGGGGDARASGGNLIKLLLSDPGALAKALMGKRMA